jgi:hypothetical protein
MGEIVSFLSHKYRKAAQRGFREWRRLFEAVASFDESTRWADLPDEVVVFFCEENPESKHSFYDLIMRSQRLGNGHDFEVQSYDRLTALMNAYFFIMDQARFECMRRLGWLTRIPRGEKSIIQAVIDSGSFDYGALFETPGPTPEHPAYEEDLKTRGIDRAALVRRFFPEAIRLFKAKLEGKTSVIGKLNRKDIPWNS